MKYFSMFTGIGGFEKGIEDAKTNWECVGYSEIDKYANAIYRYHYPNTKNYGDATRIVPNELPDFDCIVGGFPCQPFSISGNRHGFKDTRGTLFFDILRIARIKRPGYLWLENVKGLLNHKQGNTFQIIIESLDELGYCIQWQVLDSQCHQVPQHRERVFIICHFRDLPPPKIFPITESYGLDYAVPTISGGYRKRRGEDGAFIKISENKIRWLTINEIEVLQGFPKDWTKYGLFDNGEVKEISDAQRYKCCGNAVTTNVIKDIAVKWSSSTTDLPYI